MTESKSAPGKARPSALFIADHPALDFLNSHATPAGQPVEWMADGTDFLDWLNAAGMATPEVAARFSGEPALDAIAGEARKLRTWLGDFVRRHAGAALTAKAATELQPLNRLLAKDEGYLRVVPDAAGHLNLERLQQWVTPETLLQPLAAAIADLVCHADFRLIRRCAGHDCSLMFLDRTKAHARRWCSMALCGNRAKAAAHRARHRAD